MPGFFGPPPKFGYAKLPFEVPTMATLSEVSAVLRDAHDTLPSRDAITDLAYLLDVDPYGAECLVVYITTSDERTLDPADKRAVEAALRTALSRDVGYSVYFRWQTENERVEGRRTVARCGLIAQPHSALS
jgi:hypothetical protein